MDLFIPIVIFVLVCILISICGFCCKRKREGTVYGLAGSNITVTTQPISASPVVQPPYPVEPRHPTPNTGAPNTGFTQHNPPYPTHNPHPVGGAPLYYHPPVGIAPFVPTTVSSPYSPIHLGGGTAPYPDYSAQPPTYSEAVSQCPIEPPLPTKEGYSKQAPYNPNY